MIAFLSISCKFHFAIGKKKKNGVKKIVIYYTLFSKNKHKSPYLHRHPIYQYNSKAACSLTLILGHSNKFWNEIYIYFFKASGIYSMSFPWETYRPWLGLYVITFLGIVHIEMYNICARL